MTKTRATIAPQTIPDLPYDFKYYAMRGRGENTLDSNLTELNASYFYYHRGYVNHNDWFAHIGRYMAVARAVKNTTTLLDVGCGMMNLPIALHHNKFMPALYWGFDLRATKEWSKYMTWKVPTRLVKLDLVLDDPTSLPEWPTEGFDITTCFEVFEHVPRNKQKTLVERLLAWTKPGGLCFFSTPNAGVSDSTAENHIGPDGKSRERSYDEKIAIVEAVGFKILSTFGTFARMDRLPESAHDHPTLRAAKSYLPHAWYSVMVAAANPEKSNNAIFIMRRPK